MSNNKNIVLIGMSGCGKTYIGEALAQKLKQEFIDIDQYIEASESKTITEIFKQGETFFRDIETQAVLKFSEKSHSVISTGGGVVKREENMQALKRNSLIFFINRSVDDIIGDIDATNRPMIKSKASVEEIYNQRLPLYKKYSDFEIINSASLEEVVDKIIKVINQQTT